MRKYLIVDTWNGEGYSECNAWFMVFEDDNNASLYSKRLAQSCGPDEEIKFYVDEKNIMDKAWIYNHDCEDSGAIHFREIQKDIYGVIIRPMVNDYEIVTTLFRWNEVIEMIKDHEEFRANDKKIFGQCYDLMGKEEDDWILMTPEMMCCHQEVLEYTLEGDNVENEVYECPICKKCYNVPIEIVRDWKNREEV